MILNTNILQELQTLKRYKDSYAIYYGKLPQISRKKSGNVSVVIRGIERKIHFKILNSLASFYNYRMLNSKFSFDPLDDGDFQYLEDNWKKNIFPLSTISLMIGISETALRINLKKVKSIKEVVNIVRIRKPGVIAKQFTWNGETGDCHFWGKKLGITGYAFICRYKKHKNAVYSFMNKEEYRNLPKKIKSPKVSEEELTQRGSRVYRDEKRKVVKRHLDEVESYMEYGLAVNIIGRLIFDSKVNLVKRNKDYFHDSRLFLLNRNGMLEMYLDMVKGIDTAKCLRELFYFAIQGYKSADENDYKE